ncbi:TPA: DUF551 domain-containing protein [Escherichia coli]|nr:DUF551 domain-containing protein [Escherichia coli]HDX3255599.1 DUF551 domain-containing protein [Escherichia coli]HDX3321367.1 DUF551 domain-containing protein [Escherichia coli]HDX3326803.1 DUF551 domain-containing protein [Escherichia coli]HEA3648731.1 DUF551 domain-containing protein [Escherichia coli]
MTTITKEFTKEQLIEQAKKNIEVLRVAVERVPGAYDAAVIHLKLAEITLASLKAEPVAKIIAHYPLGIDVGKQKFVQAIGELPDFGGHLFAAPPVPVVPAALPENDDEDGHDIDYLEPSEVYSLGRTAGWNACRAAMLHGAEPVSQTYKLPPLSSSEVNDAAWKLHNMLTEHGPLNGRQFNNLKGCFYEALKVAMRNYPGTPDSWISCSERMPNTKTAVLVAVEFDRKGDWRMKWATYIPGHPDANDGWIIPGASWKPSHWMPLPEPPQEVNQ